MLVLFILHIANFFTLLTLESVLMSHVMEMPITLIINGCISSKYVYMFDVTTTHGKPTRDHGVSICWAKFTAPEVTEWGYHITKLERAGSLIGQTSVLVKQCSLPPLSSVSQCDKLPIPCAISAKHQLNCAHALGIMACWRCDVAR